MPRWGEGVPGLRLLRASAVRSVPPCPSQPGRAHSLRPGGQSRGPRMPPGSENLMAPSDPQEKLRQGLLMASNQILSV